MSEKKNIQLYKNEGKLIEGIIEIFEEAPDNEDLVLIELTIEGTKISYHGENFFQALQALREHLEEQHIQIICNGAAINVFPSPMQLSMGTGFFSL